MKRLFGLAMPVVLLVFLFGFSPGSSFAAEMKPMTLRLAAVFPPPKVSLASYAAQLFMDEVTKKTNGKIKFQPFWGGALGKPAEHLTAVEKGVADLALTHRWYTPGKLPLAQFEYVFPFGPTDPLIVVKAKRQIYEEFPQFKENLAKYNALLLFSGPGCAYQILSKTPVQSLADFKGKKISLIGRYFGRWVEPAGAVPVVAPAADRYTMLQTGVTDMDFLPLDLFASYKIQEQAPNLILVNALTACWYDLMINTKTFAKFPKDVQDILIETGKEIELKMAKEGVPMWTKKVMAEFEKQGVKTFQFPEEERAKWSALVSDIPAEWAEEVTKQGYPGWDIIARYQQLTTEMGYKWPRKWGVKK